jgi:hypothetical protein
MKMKQFQSILAVVTVATSITASSLPSQAIPLDEILDNAGKSFVRGMFGISPERQEAPQPGGFNNDVPQQTIPASNSTPQQNNFNNSEQPSSPVQQPNIQKLAMKCTTANANNVEMIDRDSPESNISVDRRSLRVAAKVNLSSWGNTSFEKTCRILRHPSSNKVRIGFAIPDNSTLISARVSIYVDGQEKTSRILGVGQARAFTSDIAGARDYAFVVKPLDGYGHIYPIGVKQPE